MPHSTQIPSDVDSLIFLEGNLADIHEKPFHFKCGFYLICTSGSASVSTGAENYILSAETELIFLTGSPVLLSGVSDDFHIQMVLFPREMLVKAMLPIDTPYLNYAYEDPCYHHNDTPRARMTWHIACSWLDLAKSLFSDSKSQFRSIQEFNFLQGLLLWLFSTAPDKADISHGFSTLQQLCKKFMMLIRENAATRHDVSFYAEKLCVSARYLHKATSSCLDGKSPKEIIDNQLVAEIEVRLNTPSLTITEIAEALNFADQSYLSRFFKRHTGLSPQEWRSRL